MSNLQVVIAYIGLGSNLDNPVNQIKMARAAIASLNDAQEIAFSSLYQSPPMGPQDQPDYVNAVMAISTTANALDLLHQLQHIELNQGRKRTGQRWGARTLDLDLLLYSDQCIDLPELTVPHTGMLERAFVLAPLYEIAPNLIIPGKGNLLDWFKQCQANQLTRLN